MLLPDGYQSRPSRFPTDIDLVGTGGISVHP
jgi:hypothetical protein